MECKMKNGFAFAILGIAVMMVLVTSDAFAGDEEIWGTYRLITATNKILDTGDVVSAFGEHPKGYIIYGKDGRMLVLITYDGRIKPPDVTKQRSKSVTLYIAACWPTEAPTHTAAIELSITLTYRGMKLGAVLPSFVTLLGMAIA
jgi:hypothetical protein